MNLSKAFKCLTVLGLVIILFFPMGLYSYIKSVIFNKSLDVISISSINPYIDTICTSPKNRLYFKILAKHNDGSPLKYEGVETLVNGPGKIVPSKQLTDKSGEAIFYYQPDMITQGNKDFKKSIEITTTTSTGIISQSVKLTLVPTPVILVHGYREKALIFNNLKTFLSDKGITSFAIDYDSTLGVDNGSRELSSFIEKQKKYLFSNGILSNDFTIICHSFGGLVSRYYTSIQEYLKNENVNKIIFLSVPHNGTDIALVGENFYNDQSLKDLTPGNYVFSTKFPSLINKGLNFSIQTANILGQYDEVVTPESANLSDWKIDTIVYNVGENARTFDNIIKGNIIEAPNHNSVLNNQKIFEKIFDMLNKNLPTPIKIS